MGEEGVMKRDRRRGWRGEGDVEGVSVVSKRQHPMYLNQ